MRVINLWNSLPNGRCYWTTRHAVFFPLSIKFLNRIFSLQNSDILNLGTGSVSWFEANGPGCKPIFSTNGTLEDPFRPIRPDRVEGCYLDYWIIEIVHSAVQIFFTVSAIMTIQSQSSTNLILLIPSVIRLNWCNLHRLFTMGWWW